MEIVLFWEEDVNSPTAVTALSPGVLSGSQINWEPLAIRFTCLSILVGGGLDMSVAGLGGRVTMGTVFKTNEYVETLFLTLALRSVPVKTVLSPLLSLSKFVHNLNTFSLG